MVTFFINCNEGKVIQVVELDSTILNLARDYFDFAEDADLKVFLLHICYFFVSSYNVLESSRTSSSAGMTSSKCNSYKRENYRLLEICKL